MCDRLLQTIPVLSSYWDKHQKRIHHIRLQMGAFSPSSKVTTQYKAVYIEKNVGTRSTRVLTHMVIKEVKSEVGRAKPFFHFTCPWDRYFADFGCLNTKSTRPKKKKTAKTEWLWLTKVSRRKQVDDEPSIPQKSCYSCHKQRDVFGKLHKTCNFWSRQI